VRKETALNGKIEAGHEKEEKLPITRFLVKGVEWSS
jgi:hypothetical protein